MKAICNNCGKEFYSKTPRHTCSTKCAVTRQVENIRQMKMKEGEMFKHWHDRMVEGLAMRNARNYGRKRGDN